MHPFSRFSRKVIKPVSQLGHQRYGDGWQWETGKVILWTIMHTYINHSFLLPTYVYTIKISASQSYMTHEVHSLLLPSSYHVIIRNQVDNQLMSCQPSQLWRVGGFFLFHLGVFCFNIKDSLSLLLPVFFFFFFLFFFFFVAIWEIDAADARGTFWPQLRWGRGGYPRHSQIVVVARLASRPIKYPKSH